MQTHFPTIMPHDMALFFYGDNILVRAEHEGLLDTLLFTIGDIIPSVSTLAEKSYFYIATIDNQKIYAIYVDSEQWDTATRYCFQPLRQVLQTVSAESVKLLCRSKQLLTWHRLSLFCGQCGSPTQLSDRETAKLCVPCARTLYPAFHPAIIVLIEKGDELLLARSPHFKPGVYSALAGFMEPGESCEATIVREVAEEVGIQIKNIEYVGSQSWPFPNSLMLGFRAQYADGEINIDKIEIEDAGWFNCTNLPQLPLSSSIARTLIDSFITRKSEGLFTIR